MQANCLINAVAINKAQLRGLLSIAKKYFYLARIGKYSRLLTILLSLFFVFESAFAQVALNGGLPWRGFNLAGAEFRGGLVQGAFPGVHGDDYVYPDSSFVPGYDTPQQFVDKGANIFRLPFRWERLQPSLKEPLNAEELGRLRTTVTNLTAMGAFVLLDPHNYARYSTGNPDEVKVIGSPELPSSTFADFWGRVAEEFKDNSQVVFGIMNEPFDIDTAVWVSATNDAIAAIRATGATNVVLVQGNGWGSSWWFEEPDAAQLLNIQDPLNRYAIEAHIYFDETDSGGEDSCASEQIGVQRIQQVTNWMRANKRLAFIGELGAGESQTCLTAIDNVLSHMEQNQDIYLGYTFWAAGPYWGAGYELLLEPVDGVHRPQISVIEQHFDWGEGTGFCNDGIRNGTESDIDCGGICGQCVVGDSCDDHAECDSWNCAAGVCAAASCNDGIHNGDELAQDCGGSCSACACSEVSYEAETVFSSTGGAVPEGWNIWSDGYIATTHTFTGTEDQIVVRARGEIAAGEWPHLVLMVGGVAVGETVVTSANFEFYAFNLPSIAGSKEVRLVFDNDLFDPTSGQDRNLIIDRFQISCGEVVDTCSDGSLNGLETDIDCGGTCGACGDGQVCSVASDCGSNNCESGACISCNDGSQNGNEADVDCGGDCGSCGDGQFCSDSHDCASGHCENGSCISCNDGRQNGSETQVDCGGVCGSCPGEDDDGDGIINSLDECHGTVPGIVVDMRGCALINDQLIEAENYSAASDSDAGNNGSTSQCTYNGSDVDVQDASENGCNVGWTKSGEWLEYSVELSAGVYQVSTRVASDTDTGGYTISIGDQLVGSDTVADTQGWQMWETHLIGSVTVEAGAHTLRIAVTGDSFNLNWLSIEAIHLFIDADGDGVRDDVDLCLGTVPGSIVETNGCVIDSDKDGITDDLDNCANTPSGVLVDADGCPLPDTDGDGVPDIDDAFVNDPGESVDTDQDGMGDNADQCDNTPQGIPIGSDGCGLDEDSDGVFDINDDCNATSDGEPVNERGCSSSQVDSDSDGIFDNQDLCAGTPEGEVVDGDGCSDSQLGIPFITYPATSRAGGPGLGGCTGAQNCTGQSWGVDLNSGTGFSWLISGGINGGPVELFVKVAVPSGSRSMSLWVNGSQIGIVATSASESPRPSGAEFGPFPVSLLGGKNQVELRDTEGDMEFDVHELRVGAPSPASNLLDSDGTLPNQGGFTHFIFNEADVDSVSWAGEAFFDIVDSSEASWHIQIHHALSVVEGEKYVACFKGKAAAPRMLAINIDEGAPGYATISGGDTVALTTDYQEFTRPFIASKSDESARLTFNLGIESEAVWLDDIGLYVGSECGAP